MTYVYLIVLNNTVRHLMGMLSCNPICMQSKLTPTEPTKPKSIKTVIAVVRLIRRQHRHTISENLNTSHTLQECVIIYKNYSVP